MERTIRAMEPVEVARLHATDSGYRFDEELETLFLEVERLVREDSHKQ